MNRRQWMKLSAVAAAGLSLSEIRSDASPLLLKDDKTKTRLVARLNANENPYGPAMSARKAMAEAIVEGNRYAGSATTELEKIIAAREGLTPEHVVIGCGSWEVLCLAGIAYGLAGGEIVAANTTFEALPRYAALVGAKVVRVPLNEKHEHDLEAMNGQVSASTKLVYLCNPNNPTGTVVQSAKLRSFCEDAAKRSAVFVDEAYLEYLEPAANLSMIDLVKRGENVIVSRTFSKIHGLAGMRVGYGLARPNIAAKLKQFRMSSANVVGLRAAIASYSDVAFVTESRRKNKETRAWLSKEMDSLGFKYAESQANFIWLNVGPQNRNLPALLADQNVFIRHTRDPLTTDWARVTVGTMEEMKLFVTVMKAVAKN